MSLHELQELAVALTARNQADADIAQIIGRPAEKGHVGEFIASWVFGINLERSASHKGIDGHFMTAALAGRSVNVKFYAKLEGSLDLCLTDPPDYYLVLTGPRSPAASSSGGHRPFAIEHAFLFEAAGLHSALRERGVKLGDATSVARQYWDGAELCPEPRNPHFRVTDEQRAGLALFSSASLGV